MLVIKKARSNNIKDWLNATDIDDRSGKEGVLVAIMTHDELVILGRLAGAILIGAMIGFERTFHGRPAGFRTHALVCLAYSLSDALDD
jgi:MgtC family